MDAWRSCTCRSPSSGFYGGIYIFNDIADVRSDAAHPQKRQRPIAAGRISIRRAAVAATALIGAGFATAALFLPFPLIGGYVLALGMNAAYSAGGRNLPYVDIALNSATHPVRFLMGALLVGRVPPWGHLAVWFCLAAGVACVRRIVELEAGGAAQRPALTYYSVRGLSRFADCGMAFIIALCVLDRFQSPGFYLVSSTAYLLFVLFARRIGALQRSLAWLWLR